MSDQLALTTVNRMTFTVLHVADCPHVPTLVARIHQAAGPDAAITMTVVNTEDEAIAAGMHGSPTLFIDGRDPFPADASPSISCALAIPTTEQIGKAMQTAD